MSDEHAVVLEELIRQRFLRVRGLCRAAMQPSRARMRVVGGQESELAKTFKFPQKQARAPACVYMCVV